MVHHIELHRLHVGKVAGDVNGDDLPLAGFHLLVSMHEAFDQQTAMIGMIAISDDFVICGEGSPQQWQVLKSDPLLPRKRDKGREFSNQPVMSGARRQ